jgi:hypothetical protein
LRGDACVDVLRRRDPRGYYVLTARREALELLRMFDVIVEDAGSFLLVRVRSRSLAQKVCELLLRKGLLSTHA